MNGATILALAVALGAGRGDSLSASARADVGQWRLSEVGGKIGCTVTLTDQASPGGLALQTPLACRHAFPPLRDVSVWNLDARGAPIFSDLRRRRVVAFNGPIGGPFLATASDGKAWRLEPAPGHSATVPPAPPAPPAPPPPPPVPSK
jgi:hypothetical protein